MSILFFVSCTLFCICISMRKIDEFSKGSLSHEEAKIFALSLSLSLSRNHSATIMFHPSDRWRGWARVRRCTLTISIVAHFLFFFFYQHTVVSRPLFFCTMCCVPLLACVVLFGDCFLS